MKKKLYPILLIVFLLMQASICIGQETGVTIIDSRHYSHSFAEMRHFRIFLPRGYYQHPEKKYPVIYFLHGWSQRYFGSGDDRYSEYDRRSGNSTENMESFASTHDVIIVKSDGYNRSPDEPYYLRPYNIGPVETYRQFPIYFPELIEHIDANYRTKASRENRAITGLSMGGFMAFVIGGKYPHLFCAVGNFCGSPEFVIGPKDFPVEYRHLDMYKNYGGMKVRLNYGDMDFIRGYHEDLNRVWTQVMDNYQYKIYPGGHTTSGFSEMFNFLYSCFNQPASKPKRWDHIDFYPEFQVWDYTVRTDRVVPGYTLLENVDQRGFRCSVREWLPDGELIPSVRVSVQTAPVFEKNQWYTISSIDLKSFKVVKQTLQSDLNGRLRININGAMQEIGINKKEDAPNISIAGVEIMNADWIVPRKETAIRLKLLNKGNNISSGVVANISAITKDVVLLKSEMSAGSIGVNEIKSGNSDIVFKIVNEHIDRVKFKVTVRDVRKNSWVEYFDLPVLKESPEIKDFVVADGKVFTVATRGTDSVTTMIGRGNGDGVANPGEMIEILVNDQGRYWRTQLFTADKFINPGYVSIRQSDNWASYDNVGGSMKYSIALVSADCPQDHNVRFFAEYWLPDKPLHTIRQATVNLPVSGKDHEPPVLAWVKVAGNNLLQAKLYDGSVIKSVAVTLKADKKETIHVLLNDNGIDGDLVKGDHIFSATVPEQHFGIYKGMIEALDSFDNKLSLEMEGTFILH